MAITISKARVFEQFQSKLKAQSEKKLLVGVMTPDIATYAMYLEYGWVQQVTPAQNAYLNAQLGRAHQQQFTTLYMPPRPFMRSTYAEKKKEWIEKFRSVLLNTLDVDQALGIMGQLAVDDIKETIIRAGTDKGAFPRRSPLTMALFEAQGEIAKSRKAKKGKNLPSNVTTDKPLILSGKLVGSITWKLQ